MHTYEETLSKFINRNSEEITRELTKYIIRRARKGALWSVRTYPCPGFVSNKRNTSLSDKFGSCLILSYN